MSDDVDIAELDERYAMKEHTHSSVPSHNHDYAHKVHTHDTTHSHDADYADKTHNHNYASSSHTHNTIFRSGTSTNPSLSKGEPYLNTSQKVIYVGL